MHADIRTWAFNPPGGLVSRNLNRVLDTFCTSLVVGKDAVSRGTVNNLSRLMDEMVTALARCRCGLSYASFSLWLISVVMKAGCFLSSSSDITMQAVQQAHT